jgi:hypothetical protein
MTVGFVVEPPMDVPLPAGSAVPVFGMPVAPVLCLLIAVESVLLPEMPGEVFTPLGWPLGWPFISVLPDEPAPGTVVPLPATGGCDVLCATAIDETPTSRTADIRILEIIAVLHVVMESQHLPRRSLRTSRGMTAQASVFGTVPAELRPVSTRDRSPAGSSLDSRLTALTAPVNGRGTGGRLRCHAPA